MAKKGKGWFGGLSDRAVIGIFVAGACLMALIPGDPEYELEEDTPGTSTVAGCEENWRRCGTLRKFIDESAAFISAQAACQGAARRVAKYGEPEFPWGAFGSVKKNPDALNLGVVTLIEDDAKFQNGFGAMRHVGVQVSPAKMPGPH